MKEAFNFFFFFSLKNKKLNKKNKGKLIIFEQANFPGAIAVTVEFDKRC